MIETLLTFSMLSSGLFFKHDKIYELAGRNRKPFPSQSVRANRKSPNVGPHTGSIHGCVRGIPDGKGSNDLQRLARLHVEH